MISQPGKVTLRFVALGAGAKTAVRRHFPSSPGCFFDDFTKKDVYIACEYFSAMGISVA